MARRIATGIDIGTYQVKLVVVEELSDKNGGRQLRIIGTGLAESKGLRHGYIVNKEEVAASIREAKRQAELVARVPIRAGFLAVGGISLDEARAAGRKGGLAVRACDRSFSKNPALAAESGRKGGLAKRGLGKKATDA